MKRQKTTAELIDTGYWIALLANQPIEVIELLFQELNPTPEEISNYWDIINIQKDILF